MKYLFSCVLIFTICLPIHTQESQFSVVVDKDGYANVRDVNKKIVDKIASGALVWCFESVSEWVEVDYINSKGEHDGGHIHRSRLVDVAKYKKIPVAKETESSIILKKDSIEIAIGEKKFTVGNRKIVRKSEYNNTINGNWIWGTDGALPEHEYAYIKVSINGKRVDIPSKMYNDVFNPNINYTKANYDTKNDILYIQSLNGDGAGGYIVCWVIEKGRFRNRFVSHGF